MSVGLPAASRRSRHFHFSDSAPSMIASEEPWVRVPVVSPGAWKRSASIRMQRCSISAVCGYSAWSMKLRCRFSSMTRCASGSIQVVTKVARLRSGMPSTASSSPTRRIASIAVIGSSGIALSGAPSVIHSPTVWRASSSRSTFIRILLIAPTELTARFVQSNHARPRSRTPWVSEIRTVRRDGYETGPMSWILLITAGAFETGFAVMLKQSDGFTKLVPTILFAVFALASFGLLNLALKDLPVGTAYAVWTGIGAAGTATVGILALGEPAGALRIMCICLIVIGAIGLQAVESH